MNLKCTLAVTAAITIGASPVIASPITTISIASITNRALSGVDPSYPVSSQTLGGIPFALNGNAWDSNVAAGGGAGTRTVSVPLNVFGVSTVYTLINTLWGVDGHGGTISYLSLTFNGSSGDVYTLNLYGDSDIRDYNQNASTTNSINGTSTINVVNLSTHRLDMQAITLPSVFQSETLTSMSITDTGNANIQRTLFSGISVAVPEPSSLGLLAMGTVMVIRRRRPGVEG